MNVVHSLSASSLPASHFAGIYGQRARHCPDAGFAEVLHEVASNLRDFGEEHTRLLTLEDAHNWYLLFLNADAHLIAAILRPKPPNAPKVIRELVWGISWLERIVEARLAECSPEPLLTTVVLGELGGAFVADATPRVATFIFERVENVLRDGTSSERDAIATGFLEGVVSAVDRDPAAGWVLTKAGPAAKAYIDAWNRFCGVEV